MHLGSVFNIILALPENEIAKPGTETRAFMFAAAIAASIQR